MLLDQETQNALRERFNPDGSPLREMQMQMLELLRYADRICRSHNIPYWLSSGTCLGAVRHGGFIPWDDDVDIEMLTPDFRRFCRAAEQEPDPRFVLHTHASDRNYFYHFAKLRWRGGRQLEETNRTDLHFRYRGVFIDIFCIEPSSGLFIHKASDRLLKRCLHTNFIRPEWWRRICREFWWLVSDKLMTPAMRLATRYGAGDRLRHRLMSPFHAERHRSEIFPLGEADFEGLKLPVPGDTDAYLRRMFGDYRSLPDHMAPHASL